ncbi:hypothetical protein HAX54_037521 [Datura stramonium]|uniref:Uncharacterized protein n=1 Tax=Datura stramonium TaxID=4076 RepID=A0ABS8VL67_DATST|nr:hypothetical protein [Datura stramonium]
MGSKTVKCAHRATPGPKHYKARHAQYAPHSPWARYALQKVSIDYPREHSRVLRVGPGYEEPLDDDVAMEDEMARVESDLECSDDNEEDSKMGEAALFPTNEEE